MVDHSNPMLHVLRPQDIDAAQAIEALRPAFDRSDAHKVEPWVLRCQQDQAQLWRLHQLWAITEVIQTRLGRSLHIVAMAGVYDSALLQEIEDWGRCVGCMRIYFTGRPGWKKLVPQYRLRTVTMEKDL